MAVELVAVDDVKTGTHIPAVMHIQASAPVLVIGAGMSVPAPCAEDSLQTQPRGTFLSPIIVPGKRDRMPPWRRDWGWGEALTLTQEAALAVVAVATHPSRRQPLLAPLPLPVSSPLLDACCQEAARATSTELWACPLWAVHFSVRFSVQNKTCALSQIGNSRGAAPPGRR